MDNKKTLREILLSQKLDQELVPHDLFVDNLRKSLNNVIEHKKLESNKETIVEEKIENKSGFNIFSRYKKLSYFFMLTLLMISTLTASLIISKNQKVADPGKPVIVAANLGNVDIKADKSDKNGVETDSTFIIITTNAAKETELKSAIKVEPETAFILEKESDTQFRLKFAENLKDNSIYKFTVKTKESGEEKTLTWAFQTKDKFRIISSLPRDKATSVPLDIGIELNLSHLDISDNFAELLIITPQIEGRIEKHNKTLSFIPTNKLSPQTLYTVTLKPGLKLNTTGEILDKEYIFQSETLYKDSSSTEAYISFKSSTSEFSKSVKPALNIYAQSDAKELNIEVYKFQDKNKYIESLGKKLNQPSWSYYNQDNYKEESSSLERVLTFNTSLVDQNYLKYFVFPQTLEAGYYLVQAKADDKYVQNWMQITDLSAYFSLSNTKTLAWVNDVSTSKPISGASVKLLGSSDAEALTDERGTAFFNTSESVLENKDKAEFFEIKDNNGNILIVPALQGNEEGNYHNIYDRKVQARDNYWSYLYTDRSVYKGTDTLNYWALAKPKDQENLNNRFKLVVEKYSYTGYNYDNILVTEKDISVNENGIITDELKLENYNTGSYTLNLKLKDEVITATTFTIEDYTKPTYKIDLEASKRAVFAGEKVTFKGKTSFYDGTPIPNLNLTYEGDKRGEITSDANGDFEIELNTQNNDEEYFSLVQNKGFSVRPSELQEGESTESSYTQVFSSNLSLKAESEVKDNNALIKVKLNNVDLDKINNTQTTSYDNNTYLGNPSANTEVRAKVLRIEYESKEAGEYYDFINKKNVKKYSYTSKEVFEKNLSVSTDENGEGLMQFSPAAGKNYIVEFEATDSLGYKTKASTYVYNFNQKNSPSVSLKLVTSKNDFAKRYKVGEEETISFKESSRTISLPQDGQYLYVIARRGIQDFKLQSSPDFKVIFEEEDIPNFYVKGVYFNGSTYLEATDVNLIFDQKENALEVKITTDKASYKPKDKVTLNIDVKDKNNNGKEAEVNINLVDESLYSLMYYDNDILRNTYMNIASGVISSYTSHQYPIESQQNGGGAGAGGPRSEFLDTAVFQTVKTDKSGKAKLEFSLPDNLTSWRITSQAVTTDKIPLVGLTLLNIPVKLPFFVDTSVSSIYLEGDKPQIRLRAIGENLSSDTDVNFTLSSDILGIKDQKIKSKISENNFFEIANLKEGEHELKITAKSGDLEDTVVKKIKVLKTKLSQNNSKFYTLKQDLILEGSKNLPTTLVFTDKNKGQLYSDLTNLANSNGDRLDQKLTRIKAKALLKEYFNENYFDTEEFSSSNYLTKEGGISLFPYSDSDLLLTAQIADISKDLFDTNSLKTYFEKVLSDPNESKERTAIALYGMASLNEPVLIDINYFTEENKDLSATEKIYLGLALAKLGDKTGAEDILNEIIKSSGESLDPYIRILINNSNDDSLRMTALASNLAALTSEKRAERLYGYISNNSTKDILLNMEKLSYIANTLPNLKDGEIKFAYTINDKRTEKSLSKKEVYKVQLSPEELKSIKLENIEGETGLVSYWSEPLAQENIVKDQSISISKQYSINGNVTTEFDTTNLIKVTLSNNLPETAFDGCYQVTDYLPAGLRAVNKSYQYGIKDPNISYPYEVDDNKISFCAFKTDTKPIVYYARPITKGEFKDEGAIIQSLQSIQAFNISNTNEIVIK